MYICAYKKQSIRILSIRKFSIIGWATRGTRLSHPVGWHLSPVNSATTHCNILEYYRRHVTAHALHAPAQQMQ